MTGIHCRHLSFATATVVDELKPCQFRQVDNHGRILCNVIKTGDREVSVNLCRACPVSQINCQNLRAGLEKKISTPITVRFATGRVEVWDDAPATVDFKQAACAAKTMPIHSPRDCAGCPIRLPNVIPQNAIQVAHRSKPGVSEPAAPPVAQNVIAAQPPAAQQARQRAVRQAQPVAQAASQPVAQIQPAVAQAQVGTVAVDVGAANDLIARARVVSERKAQEKQQREIERAAQLLVQQQEQELASLTAQQAQAALVTQAANGAPSEAKPKIIRMKEWLKEQANKKQKSGAPGAYKPQTVTPDADGVSDIIYAPLVAQAAQAYQETIDYERCVGWTD